MGARCQLGSRHQQMMLSTDELSQVKILHKRGAYAAIAKFPLSNTANLDVP
jgi:hypothetical protein